MGRRKGRQRVSSKLEEYGLRGRGGKRALEKKGEINGKVSVLLGLGGMEKKKKYRKKKNKDC